MEVQRKNYTEKYISEKYNKLPIRDKNIILYDALNYMQQYNGRSKLLCIAMAMGYENTDGFSDTYTKSR